MEARIQLIAILAAIVLFVVVLELVRRRKLLERYALLWLLSALAVLVLAAWSGALSKLANALGIFSPPNALFFVALAFTLLLLLHFSVAVSRLTDQVKILAQRLAILEEEAHGKETRLGPSEQAGQAGAGETPDRSSVTSGG